ncbi:MAG TPA: hypothetical protein VK563_06405 [Puia sp.]|nr:hypothetical protein [Puia sp.]
MSTNPTILEQTNNSTTSLVHHGEARKFNQWLFERAKSYVKGSTLEIGSGTGNVSELFIKNKQPLYLSDPKDQYCRLLNERHKEESMVRGVLQIDLKHPEFEIQCAELLGRFSTVVAMNIVDKASIVNAKLLLRIRGHLILSLPANTALFNGLGQGFEKWRSENYASIQKLISKDFEIIRTAYFNLVGISGWWLSGDELKKRELAKDQLGQYEKLVSVFRITESMVFNREGLSAIVVGRKQ